MYPACACAVGLVEELVEDTVGLDDVVEFAQVIHAFHLQVGGFTAEVLARRFAAHGCIECGAAVAAGDVDRRTERHTGRFEDIAAQGTQVRHYLRRGCVVDMLAVCRLAAHKLGKGEMVGQLHFIKKNRGGHNTRLIEKN